MGSSFDLFPDLDLIPGVHHRGPPSSKRPHSPGKSRSPAEPHFRVRFRSPTATRALNMRHPLPARLPSSDGRGCGIEKLESIRLISLANDERIFELRRYTFPVNKRLKMKMGKNRYDPMPTQEQIVLSTSDGDVFAILEHFDLLAGIYTYRESKRAKINMRSGNVTPLTRKEIAETPVGSQRPIGLWFRVQHLNPRA